MSDKPVITLVFALLAAVCPFAIFGGVPFPVVNSLQSQSVSFPHIGVEVFEQAPPFTNRNPPKSVVMVGWAIRVAAPLDHGSPNTIGFCFGATVGLVFSDKFMKPAPAAFGVSSGHIVGRNNNRVSTVANTIPLRQCMPPSSYKFSLGTGQRDKFSESLTSYVYCVWHDALYNGVTYTST